MKKNKVKSIIRESIYNLLNEYSSEQRLPFDDNKFKNKNYLEQYTDWLEDFGKYGKLPPSKMDFWDELRKAIQVIFDKNLRNRAGQSLGFSNDAEKGFNDLHERIAPYLQFNSEGNIYVERAIQIDGSASSYNTSDENGKDTMQLYHSLVKNYNNNVGGCWAFKEGMGRAYCSAKRGDVVLFKGYIRVEDIDMVKTALLIYNYKEFEIRVKPNAKVELFETLFKNKSKVYKLPLRGTLIVSASYFGNGGTYYGEYAPIDDGFGNVKEYMDRKGNIYSLSSLIKDSLSQGKSLNDISDEIEGVVWSIGEGLYILSVNNFCTIVDKHGNIFDDGNTWLQEVDDFHDGCAAIQRKDGKWAYINTEGQQICDWYRMIWPFYNGYAKVQRNDGKLSFINKHGEQIGDWYYEVYNFNNDFARVIREDGKYTFINTEGQQIGDWYYRVREFYDGFAQVQRDDGKWSLINTQGKQICDWYKDMIFYGYTLYKVQREDGMVSLINTDTDGKQICNWYKHITGPLSGFFKVQREDGMISLINPDGKQICDWCSPNTKFSYDDNSKKLIPLYNESYIRLNNLIAEALHMSIRDYLLYS